MELNVRLKKAVPAVPAVLEVPVLAVPVPEEAVLAVPVLAEAVLAVPVQAEAVLAVPVLAVPVQAEAVLAVQAEAVPAITKHSLEKATAMMPTGTGLRTATQPPSSRMRIVAHFVTSTTAATLTSGDKVAATAN